MGRDVVLSVDWTRRYPRGWELPTLIWSDTRPFMG
jgi:hypothetical protein